MTRLEKFANRFCDLLNEKEINLSQLEKMLGIRASTSSAWRNGQYFPQVEHLFALADFFGCTIDYLLGSDEP